MNKTLILAIAAVVLLLILYTKKERYLGASPAGPLSTCGTLFESGFC